MIMTIIAIRRNTNISNNHSSIDNVLVMVTVTVVVITIIVCPSAGSAHRPCATPVDREWAEGGY